MKVLLAVCIIQLAVLVRQTESGGETVLEPVICDRGFNLFGPNRNYLKSACWINDEDTYANSQILCRQENMQLFAIFDEEEANALQSAFGAFFGPGTDVWINGLQQKNGQWVSFIPERENVYSGVAPNVEYVKESRCLLYSNRDGAFAAYNGTCQNSHPVICEYDLSEVESD
jgi:hypothetical protein